MITLHHAPNTRSLRVLWLLEELGVSDSEIRVVSTTLRPPGAGFFDQDTPLGKIPVLQVDAGPPFCESGAILQFLLERFGEGRLEPPVDHPERGPYLQWLHYAEGTLSQPLSTLLWHVRYKQDAEEVPSVIADARQRLDGVLAFLANGLGDREYLVGDFTAADIMNGFLLIAASQFTDGIFDGHPTVAAYVQRLLARPALQRVLAAQA